ncbi:hypothetical protein OME_02453 [Enterococcus faecium EnGen0375]|nr:hypothetical protein OME_02453 [Enterococcus faecium EnGen0375]EOT89223.1 hypothetical protein I575_01805 [Enterococcus faecium EnGen0375]
MVLIKSMNYSGARFTVILFTADLAFFSIRKYVYY